ncbi:MAG: rlmN [Rickettsiales bacterium]|jgi:23S rRNA (adenine2503-C2)-methyltransferase|nr:rlmN [Rickettsiales bacterium]
MNLTRMTEEIMDITGKTGAIPPVEGAEIHKHAPSLVLDAGKKNLIGISKDELAAEVKRLGEPAFRAKQLWSWIYDRGVTSFDDMTNIAKPLREKLAAEYSIARPEVIKDLISEDGSRKWLIAFGKGQEAETVHIPEDDRGALCVSSQVGCTLNCSFCHTGTQAWVKNLSAYDIVSQVLVARDATKEWPSTRLPRLISNIVMMGMGEPLLNYENVAKALKIIMDGEGIAISRRRVTLSTSGIVPLMERCGAELGVGLAVSFHAVNDELRDVLVPINRKYPIAELLKACRDYPAAGNHMRVTFEYVMLKGINDSLADARELVRLIQGIPAKVNLIPFNPWPGSGYECSSWDQIEKFARVIMDAGYASPIRKPRGRDIMAACGQLKSESTRERASLRQAG